MEGALYLPPVIVKKVSERAKYFQAGKLTMKTSIIIGGGPAGCQCALWLTNFGYEVIIVEKSDRLGGQQCESPYINEWIVGTMNLQGQQIAKNIQKHIEELKIPVIFQSTIDSIKPISCGFEVNIKGEIITTRTLVIATGARPRSASFKAARNVIIGVGKKVHEFSYLKKKVAILGGGDTAAVTYSLIKKDNPLECHVYARTIRARHDLWGKIDSHDIFTGDHKTDQKAMTVVHNKVQRDYDFFIVLYGWETNIPDALIPFKNDLLDEHHFIITDNMGQTKIPNLYSAGQVTPRAHPCVATAMAEGVVVAKAIQLRMECEYY